MSTNCGQEEPHGRPKKAYFSCVIGVYFMSIFDEHPVFMIKIKLIVIYLIVCRCRVIFKITILFRS